jgi:hypothetical protein
LTRRVDFNLKTQTGNAQNAQATKPKAKQMVWVPATTGTNIGGRWVEVDGGAAAAADGYERVERKSAAALGSMQGNSGGTGGN